MQGKERSKPMRIFLLLLCVFVAGVFVGIWLDVSAPKHRNITYVVAPSQQANLQVYEGDQIQLADGTGKGKNWLVSFLGDSPCQGAPNPATPVSTCVIGANPGALPYAFACISGNESGCPDPGIQPSPTGPIQDIHFWRTVARDFHAGGEQQPPIPAGESEQLKAPSTPALGSFQAWVYCNPQSKKMSVLNPSGGPVTDIPVVNGQTVNWSGHYPFTLTATTYPDGFCSGGKPDVTNSGNAQCVVTESNHNVKMQYSVQSQSCSALDGFTVTTQ